MNKVAKVQPQRFNTTKTVGALYHLTALTTKDCLSPQVHHISQSDLAKASAYCRRQQPRLPIAAIVRSTSFNPDLNCIRTPQLLHGAVAVHRLVSSFRRPVFKSLYVVRRYPLQRCAQGWDLNFPTRLYPIVVDFVYLNFGLGIRDEVYLQFGSQPVECY